MAELCGGASGLAAIQCLLRGDDAADGAAAAEVAITDSRSAFPFSGGEASGQARVMAFLGLSTAADQLGQQPEAAAAGAVPAPVVMPALGYRERRSLASRGPDGVDDSAKFSPWLATGALSPRWVYAQLERFRAAAVAAAAAQPDSEPPQPDSEPPPPPLQTPAAAEAAEAAADGPSKGQWQGRRDTRAKHHQSNAKGGGREGAADWLQMHLTIRDFFLFTGIRAGPALFRSGGIKGAGTQWAAVPPTLARSWVRGAVGFPFHDACMKELGCTGWLSNRGRQNVASFLTKDLRADWRVGAELFELLLIDHDVAANYAK